METTKLWEDFAQAFMSLKRMQALAIVGQMPPGDFFLLECLHRENGKIRVSTLARRLAVAPPSVSRILRFLEEKEFVVRTIDRIDRRNTYVMLTPEGEKARNDAKIRMNVFFRELCDQIGENDVYQWITLSNRLYESTAEVLSKMESSPQKFIEQLDVKGDENA